MQEQQFDLIDRSATALDKYLLRKFVNVLPERDRGVFSAIDCLMRMEDEQFRLALENPLRLSVIFSDTVLIYSDMPDGDDKLAIGIKIREYFARCGEIFGNEKEWQRLIEEWDLV